MFSGRKRALAGRDSVLAGEKFKTPTSIHLPPPLGGDGECKSRGEWESNPRGGDSGGARGFGRWAMVADIIFDSFRFAFIAVRATLFLFLGWARGAVQVLVVLGREATARVVVVVAQPPLVLLRRAGGMWRVRLRLMTLAPAGEV